MQINSRNLDSAGLRINFKNDAVRLLSFYNEAPQDELTLDEFELFSLDRLQLLRGIETLRTKGFEGLDLIKGIEKVSKILQGFQCCLGCVEYMANYFLYYNL
jgi:hypothetical protein